MQVELGHDVRSMILNSPHTYAQSVCHFLIAITLGEQLDDFPLAYGQTINHTLASHFSVPAPQVVQD